MLQDSIVKRLKVDAALLAIVSGRVFDSVAANAKFPYINIGEVQVFPELGEGTDAAESSVTMHVWSREPGFLEARRIGAAIIASLHDEELAIADGSVQSMLLESARYLRDPDGLTSHGVLTFNILTDANT